LKEHVLKIGQTSFYSDMSLWDVHRTQFPFLALFDTNIYTDIMKSLVEMFEQGGNLGFLILCYLLLFFPPPKLCALPKWPLAYGYTGSMTGEPACVIIADGVVKNITNFNVSKAYAGMRQSMMDPSQPHASASGLSSYKSLGYVPVEVEERGSFVIF